MNDICEACDDNLTCWLVFPECMRGNSIGKGQRNSGNEPSKPSADVPSIDTCTLPVSTIIYPL
jgi:hypothetical protein